MHGKCPKSLNASTRRLLPRRSPLRPSPLSNTSKVIAREVRIDVDRAVDTKPGYVDTEDHPATATAWKYRAFYIMDDQKVGQCSAVVEVHGGG
ncbi:MAG: hypothetical protein RL088_1706 [Verrucomicrobiota bacterium]|jgi:hypothetical protein